MHNQQILIAGLPGSGKTTYLGALIHIIDSQEVNTSLEYDGIPENRKYLNTLVNNWLDCNLMARTLFENEGFVELKLKNEGQKLLLKIPDLSGETWRTLWGQRNCTEDVASLMSDVSSIMFFIHCDTIQKPISVMEINEQEKVVEEDNEQEKAVEEDKKVKVALEWHPEKHTPTQVMAVDILQLIANKTQSETPLKLAIILSAWDKAQDLGFSPSEFLSQEMPLLAQYINSKTDYSDCNIYGVSAQGGDLDKKGDELKEIKNTLSACDTPSKRVIIIGEKDHKHDLSLPIKKLLT